MIIDSDAHVMETEHTWDFLAPGDEKYRPVLLAPTGDERFPSTGLPGGVRREFWFIDGKIRGFRFASLSKKEREQRSRVSGRNFNAPEEAREMRDFRVRLNHMDRLDIDVQVLYNTLWIDPVAERAEVEIALCKSWNRWMAEVWKQGEGRLVWSCVAPFVSIPDAIEQMRFAKQHGAVGVTMRPFEGTRQAYDSYFYPIFEEAERLDMPITVHIANANVPYSDFMRNSGDQVLSTFGVFFVPATIICHAAILSPVHELFPRLRWAFVETAAQWLPWIIADAKRRVEGQGKVFPENVLKERNIFVTCQTNDDVPYLINWAGEDNLLIGTDYGHFDPSSDIDAITVFKKSSGLTEEQVRKILDDNPRRAYGIKVAEPALAEASGRKGALRHRAR